MICFGYYAETASSLLSTFLLQNSSSVAFLCESGQTWGHARTDAFCENVVDYGENCKGSNALSQKIPFFALALLNFIIIRRNL